MYRTRIAPRRQETWVKFPSRREIRTLVNGWEPHMRPLCNGPGSLLDCVHAWGATEMQHSLLLGIPGSIEWRAYTC